MLSIGKLAAGPGAGAYYVEQVADGREDYYSGEGESPGQWVGAGSAQLALSGRVGSDEILRLLAGQHPATGLPLRGELKPGAVAGFDLTFRSPKSVSILFGIGDPVLAGELRAGHDAAVTSALAYLEREACVVRRGKGGAVELTGGGFVAAAFEHRSSRAGDPLLHTHVVVANVAQGPDGRWTALYGRRIYVEAKTAGYLYQAVLRDELTRRLGVEWEPVQNGVADVRGVPRTLIEHFSQRRHEILEVMAARGERSARAAQVATLATRKAKQLVLRGDQRTAWRERAAGHGLDLHRLDDLFERAAPAEPAVVVGQATADRLLGAEGLTKHASSFDRRDVLQAVAKDARRGAPVAALEAQANGLLTDSRVVALADGRYTTADLLAAERELLTNATGRRGEPASPLPVGALQEAVRSRPTLSSEQLTLITRLVADPGGVQVVLAAAGTGKTFALDAARETWQQAGIPVLGCALSARAACELRDQAAVEATTITRLRMALDAGCELQPGSVLLVDEAGMVGTRDLAALAQATARAQARLVLIGDDHQLSEIEAGGAFSALAKQLEPIELRTVRRQAELWDREALAQLRNGDVELFARAYADHGRLVTRPTADQARTALVSDWWQAVHRGQDALMLAHRRSDVADLNRRARTLMRAAGRLGDDQFIAHDKVFALEEHVLITRNDRRLGVHNGQTGTITAVTDDEQIVLALKDGSRATLPLAFALAGHLDHAYALTAHRAQGATVDATFVLGSDELYREWGYTALSRHRHEARFYTSATPAFLNAPATPLLAGEQTSAAVTRALSTSRRQQLASAQIDVDPQSERLRSLRAMAQAAEDRHARLAAALDATPALHRRRRAELRARVEDAARSSADLTRRLRNIEQLAPPPAARQAPTPARAVDPLRHLDTPTDDRVLPAPRRERPDTRDLTLDL